MTKLKKMTHDARLMMHVLRRALIDVGLTNVMRLAS